MTANAQRLTQLNWRALGGKPAALASIEFCGDGALPSAFAVTDFAAAAIATSALSIAELIERRSGKMPQVRVDRRLASMWFHLSIRPIDWSLPALWDPIAGDYAAQDGWIRLHTNAPHHRAAAEKILGAQADRDAMAKAVGGWNKRELESAIVAVGGCAAEMRSQAEWEDHPQGRALAAEPLIQILGGASAAALDWNAPAARPLQGLRVLDLTRVLAGPVASRFLAGYGAEVLRIDPPDWNEPGVIPEVTLGKRCARLDLRQADDRATFTQLLSHADILLHGYRPGALDGLGFGQQRRQQIAPGLIDVSLCAYGWSGPWSGRRGFDSLVQMSSGIADAGMRWQKANKPVPLPMQALDHATGYLMAAAAIRGILHRLDRAEGFCVRLSLARTAKLLLDHCPPQQEPPLTLETPDDRASTLEQTSWGPAERLRPPVWIEHAAMQWQLPASALGSAAAAW